ncbi:MULTISPECIES: hypothetical protein [Deefgea]|uniref:Uncharacterized protein n=1 Tax=Deefgea chitinilytica TaxID=570276 RepID=A0ABS2CEV5_9NEIS|nr:MULTISPECIES: hypothetical protein [Deefgea]MBM5572592.1 hypothetical protein [Deefgea chitinilytica]MBM9889828.1 hypothetical protein [Deefgea sp. CFH1-16]
MRIAILLALLFSPCCFAISYHAAGHNLTIIESSRQEANFCSPYGYATQAQFNKWLETHRTIQRNSLQALQTQAKSAGLTEKEQLAFIQEAQQHIKKQVATTVRFNQSQCPLFQKSLEYNASLFK